MYFHSSPEKQNRRLFIGRNRLPRHPDEYEISLAWEINVYKSVIKQTQAKLAERRERFGMDLPQASQAAGEGRLSIDKKELALWSDDIEALPQWEQRLIQYREALAFIRVSASGD